MSAGAQTHIKRLALEGDGALKYTLTRKEIHVFGQLGNFASMMRQAQQIGGKLEGLNETLRTKRASGSAGGGLVEIEVNGHKVVAPVLLAPGHADGSVTVHLGFGRRAEGGRVAGGVGFNAYSIRTSDAPLAASGLTVAKGKGTYDLCVTKVHNIEHRGHFAQTGLEHPEFDTQGTFSLAGHEAFERSIIRYATVEEATANPKYASEGTPSGHTTVNKVGYNPQGEAPEHNDSFYPDAWRYDHKDPLTLKLPPFGEA